MNKELKTLIFDVNETLLNLEPIKKSINQALKNEQAADIWFSELLHYSLVETITDSFHDFSELAASVFKMNAQKHQKQFSDAEIKEILSPIKELQAYDDVVPGLKNLKKKGFQLIAFSNGKFSVLKQQLEYAGISEHFDKILSVDSVKKYKPHPKSYSYALKESGSLKEHSMLIAAHGWDITGGLRAGLKTAFIKRPGKFLFPLSETPDLQASDIKSLSEKL